VDPPRLDMHIDSRWHLAVAFIATRPGAAEASWNETLVFENSSEDDGDDFLNVPIWALPVLVVTLLFLALVFAFLGSPWAQAMTHRLWRELLVKLDACIEMWLRWQAKMRQKQIPALQREVQERCPQVLALCLRCCPGLVGKSMSAVVPEEEDCETGLQKEDPGCSPADTGAFSGVLPVDDSAAHPILGDQIVSADHGSDYSVVADAPDLETKEGDPLVDLALPQDGSNPAPPQDGQQPPLEKDQPDPSQDTPPEPSEETPPDSEETPPDSETAPAKDLQGSSDATGEPQPVQGPKKAGRKRAPRNKDRRPSQDVSDKQLPFADGGNTIIKLGAAKSAAQRRP